MKRKRGKTEDGVRKRQGEVAQRPAPYPCCCPLQEHLKSKGEKKPTRDVARLQNPKRGRPGRESLSSKRTRGAGSRINLGDTICNAKGEKKWVKS